MFDALNTNLKFEIFIFDYGIIYSDPSIGIIRFNKEEASDGFKLSSQYD
jgi:hypothetical protein